MPAKKNPIMFSMSVTPFTSDGKLDEPAYRAHLRRMVAANNGVYLGSGGAGEGHVLTLTELKRVYKIGVEECKGKVPTYANPREPRSADAMYEVCNLAHDAGVEVVQLYPLDAGHGMRPTYLEQETYYRTLLDAIKYPVSISVHVAVGYTTPVSLLKNLCADYKNIQAINVMGPPLSYFVEVKDAVRKDIALYTGIANVLMSLPLGSNGCLEAESNIAPKLCRSVLDHYLKGDMDKAGEAMTNVIRLGNIVNRWAPSTARWCKMGLKVLGLGNGVLRPPYMLPSEAEQQEMGRLFDHMRLREIEGLPVKKTPGKARR